MTQIIKLTEEELVTIKGVLAVELETVEKIMYACERGGDTEMEEIQRHRYHVLYNIIQKLKE